MWDWSNNFCPCVFLPGCSSALKAQGWIQLPKLHNISNGNRIQSTELYLLTQWFVLKLGCHAWRFSSEENIPILSDILCMINNVSEGVKIICQRLLPSSGNGKAKEKKSMVARRSRTLPTVHQLIIFPLVLICICWKLSFFKMLFLSFCHSYKEKQVSCLYFDTPL